MRRSTDNPYTPYVDLIDVMLTCADGEHPEVRRYLGTILAAAAGAFSATDRHREELCAECARLSMKWLQEIEARDAEIAAVNAREGGSTGRTTA